MLRQHLVHTLIGTEQPRQVRLQLVSTPVGLVVVDRPEIRPRSYTMGGSINPGVVAADRDPGEPFELERVVVRCKGQFSLPCV